MLFWGLSPHRRGNPDVVLGRCVLVGSIPAQAGEPRTGRPARMRSWVYPRTGGGTGVMPSALISDEGLSPHRRGNHDRRCANVRGRGSIPAQAGEPIAGRCQRQTRRVYPRTGGGTDRPLVMLDEKLGLSPHRRGNQVRELVDRVDLGSIPAQAGEPGQPAFGVATQRVYPRTGGGTPYGQMIVFSTISKIMMPDEPHLSTSYQEDPVRVNDLLRGFPEGCNAEISDCLLVSPHKDDRSRAERRPPV